MTNFQGLRCWYCGDPASTKDHIVPRMTRRRISRGAKKRLRNRTMAAFDGRNTVPACPECNNAKGDFLPDEFRAALRRYSAVACYATKREMMLHRVARRIAPFSFVFYGERGCDAVFPVVNQSRPFTYKWKIRAARNTGEQAVRIEECAKLGRKAEILAGLMNGD